MMRKLRNPKSASRTPIATSLLSTMNRKRILDDRGLPAPGTVREALETLQTPGSALTSANSVRLFSPFVPGVPRTTFYWEQGKRLIQFVVLTVPGVLTSFKTFEGGPSRLRK